MRTEIDLSIIILNYNTSELLEKCLKSIENSKTDFSLEIIVVDNNSPDDSIEMVKKKFPKVKLVTNKENYGFAKGNNLGIKISTGKYVLLLNPDTQIVSDTLQVMVQYMEENPKVGISTCRVELVDGNLDDACHRGFPTPWNAFCHFSPLERFFPQSRIFNGYHLGYANMKKIHEIDACVGAFMIVRREVGSVLNWLDEDYFWYGEDLDFCYRAKKNGWKVMYVPATKIIHWKGASSGIKSTSNKVTTASPETRKKAALASTNAMKVFYKKHYLNKYPKFVTDLVLLGISRIEKKRLANLRT